MNSEVKGLINVLVKWGYFFVLSAAVFLSLRMQPTKVVLQSPVSSVPFASFITSIIYLTR
ncbi:hypothetical protein P4S73_16290 [Paraglaciecola sp. Hal342]